MNMISERARVGRGVRIGDHVRIHDNVRLGDDCVIGDFVILGHPAGGDYQGKMLEVGAGAQIRSHCVMYEGSRFGSDLRVGHHSLVREGIEAGCNLQIGSFNDLEGDAKFGDWVRLHSNVHIGRGAVIGDLVWIYPNVVLTNDPIPPSGLKVGVTLGAGSVICTGSVVLPGTEVGIGAMVAAMTQARGKVPAGALVAGSDGRIVCSIARLSHRPSGKRHPWMNHFASYYPQEAQPRIAEIRQILEMATAALDASRMKRRA